MWGNGEDSYVWGKKRNKEILDDEIFLENLILFSTVLKFLLNFLSALLIIVTRHVIFSFFKFNLLSKKERCKKLIIYII